MQATEAATSTPAGRGSGRLLPPSLTSGAANRYALFTKGDTRPSPRNVAPSWLGLSCPGRSGSGDPDQSGSFEEAGSRRTQCPRCLTTHWTRTVAGLDLRKRTAVLRVYSTRARQGADISADSPVFARFFEFVERGGFANWIREA
jgi:hypothetical protein